LGEKKLKNPKSDIKTFKDIKLMVDTFYQKVNKQSDLSAIFNDFAKVNWEAHLPKMYAFWSKMLLGESGYNGSPFDHHIPLPINKIHFDLWIKIFNQNMDEHFEGPIADSAKLRALNIAQVFQHKLSHFNQNETN
jgi:hemoglobin